MMEPLIDKNGTRAWHTRFVNQAVWTHELRRYLLANIKTEPINRMLDVGCGTGALFAEILEFFPEAHISGLDINPKYLDFARRNAPEAQLAVGDACYMPFSNNSLDLVYFHYFMLWIPTPGKVLSEIRRVLRTGGLLFAFAEPDYEGRIDYPGTLTEMGQLQNRSLEIQGANPHAGRRLVSQLQAAGFSNIQAGILGSQWQPDRIDINLNSEWWVLRQDLETLVDQETLENYILLDRAAWEAGERVLYVPTFYAAAVNPPLSQAP